MILGYSFTSKANLHLLEATLKEFCRVVLVPIEDKSIEAFLAEYLAKVNLDVLFWHHVTGA